MRNRLGFIPGLGNLPPVITNILIINVLVFIAGFLLQGKLALNEILGLPDVLSSNFRPWQIITHGFVHGGIMHIFFNMFGLIMFGVVLEKLWGGKRFLIYYMVCLLGAAFVQNGYNYITNQKIKSAIEEFKSDPQPEHYLVILDKHFHSIQQIPGNDALIEKFLKEWSNAKSIPGAETIYINDSKELLDDLYKQKLDQISIGASGAVMGVLMAFALLFPNTELMLIFLPIPIKAKYFIAIYAGLELFLGIKDFSGDFIAHFAHLGGMLFGLILVLIWRKRRDTFY